MLFFFFVLHGLYISRIFNLKSLYLTLYSIKHKNDVTLILLAIKN